MKTKTHPIYIVVFLLAGGFLVWLATLVPSGQKPAVFPVMLDESPAQPAVPDWSEPQPVDGGSTSVGEDSARSSGPPEAPPGLYFEYLRKAYSHPIEFYGKVVDQDENPVPGADIDLGWAKPPPHEYGNKAAMQSGADGRFELKGAMGRTLTVRVAKSGYYFPKGQQTGFHYSPEYGNFQADSNNPVIFRLRKKGQGVELVTSQYGVNSHLGISPPKDATPVWVDFFERKAGGSGQMQISKLTPVWDRTDRRPHEWRLTLSIPDGGFVELTEDEFLFYPPETGYQPVLDFHFLPDREGWTDTIKRQYYIAFGNPRRYGRIKIEAWSLGGVRLEYVVNPDGRPYLEPKEVVIE